MAMLTITAKGQVTLRREYLTHLGISAGEKVAIEKLPDGRIELRAARDGDIENVFGCLKGQTNRSLSVEEMTDIAREGWAGTGRKRA